MAGDDRRQPRDRLGQSTHRAPGERSKHTPELYAASEHQALDGYSEDLLAAIATLSAEQRAVIVLRYVLEFTPGEIARALELPRGTVSSRLRRGLDVLETRLREGALR